MLLDIKILTGTEIATCTQPAGGPRMQVGPAGKGLGDSVLSEQAGS